MSKLDLDAKHPPEVQLDDFSKMLLKKGLESLMEAELTEHIGYEKNDREVKKGTHKRNGHYSRAFDSTPGRLKNVEVPRDRDGTFQNVLAIAGQNRMEQIEDLITSLYASGVAQRDIAGTLHDIYDDKLSAQTISNITDRVSTDCNAWRTRELSRRYAVIFVDALHQAIRRETVAQDAIYIVGGITFEGKRELLGLYCLGGSESATAWKEVYQDLYERGVRHILLVVMDGLTGNAEALRDVFPKTDLQEPHAGTNRKS